MTHGAIIGAGIAGLATAIFAQEKGLRVDLFERHGDLSDDEHLLWIAPNGLQLLARLGLSHIIEKASTPQEGMIFANQNLKPLMTLSGSSLRHSCGYPIVALKRKDLWRGLYESLLKKGGHVQLGRGLEQLTIKDHRPLIRLSGLDAPLPFDWVIGADGMGSKVRSVMAPESKVLYQGLRTWLGVSVTPVAEKYVGRTIEAWGKGTRFVLTSLDGRTVHFSALERAKTYEPNNVPIPEDTLPRLQDLFRDYHADISLVLKAADPTSLMRCNFGIVVGLPHTWRGSLAVIGDAAHGMPPNMGQGASLGLEDALWITESLKNMAPGSDPAAGFSAYGRGREKRVAEMRLLANSMNTLFQPQSYWASLLRNVLAGLVPDILTAKRMGRLYQPSIPPSAV